MKTVNMHEAKTHLSRLVEAATRGEPFVIARAGKPLVEVRALEPTQKPERERQLFGFLKGQFVYDEEVDRQLDEELRAEFEASIARGLFPDGMDDEAGDEQDTSEGRGRA